MNENMGSASYVQDVPTTDRHLSYAEFFEFYPIPTLTVSELIARLQKYPPDMVVCDYNDEYGVAYPIHETSIGLLEMSRGRYDGEGQSRRLAGSEKHTCDVLIID